MKKLISLDKCFFCNDLMVTVEDMGGGYFLTQCLNCGSLTTKNKLRISNERYKKPKPESRKSKKLRELKKRWG